MIVAEDDSFESLKSWILIMLFYAVAFPGVYWLIQKQPKYRKICGVLQASAMSVYMLYMSS